MIKNILFDFGGVMIGKKKGGPIKLLGTKYNIDEGTLINQIDDLVLDFEKGLLSFEDFYSLLKTRLGDVKAKDLYNLWLDRSGVVIYEDMFHFVEKLKFLGYNVFLLSDTNEVHKTANLNSGFYDVFDSLILSCDIGYSKKEDKKNNTTKIFDYALEELNIKAEESIFIDDLQENCDVANKVGIKTILAKNPQQVISDLSSILGID